MRALKVDFARQSRALNTGSLILLTLGMATIIHAAIGYAEAAAELDRWEAKYRRLEKESRKRNERGAAGTAEWEHLQTELKAANRVIARLATPWEPMLREIDATVDEQVTLLSIEPDAEKRELKIIAEAKNLEVMLVYANRVEAASIFKGAYVLSHQVQQQDPQRPIRFVLTAQWIENTNPHIETTTLTMAGRPD